MHCGLCGDTNSEVRPINIGSQDTKNVIDALDRDAPKGDYYACRACTNKLSLYCKDSFLITWTGFPCDECSQVSAFDGHIDSMPEGIVCAECVPPHDAQDAYMWADSLTERGVWLCEACYDARHYGHRQKQLQPILDQLANL